MKHHPEQLTGYTLHIKFDIAGESTPLIEMHFDHLQDAFDKFLMVKGHHFMNGFKIKPFEKMNVSEALIIDNKDSTKLISSGVTPDGFKSPKPPSGFYFRFPESVSAFEKMAGTDFSGFKGYDGDSQILMAAVRDTVGIYFFKKLIGYENLCDQTEKKLSDSNLYAVSLTKYRYDSNGDYIGNLQPYPHREDYFFGSPDQALHKLLTTDFNGLDEQVAWENDLNAHISDAVLYRNREDFELEYQHIIELHSARKHGLRIGTESYGQNGIFIGLSWRATEDLFAYPFARNLESIDRQDKIFRVGKYNDSLSRTEKVSDLLAPFEKSRQKNLRNQVKKSPAKKSRGKSL